MGDSRLAVRATRLFDGYARRTGPVMVLVEDGRITDVDFTGAGPPITRTGGHCWYLGGEAEGADQLVAAVAARARY